MTFRHRAGVSPYTSSYDFAETCVFGKQSLGPFHCGPLRLSGVNPRHPTGASLLPKLRDHFAEFLNESSSERLSILCSPTCVGLRYRHLHLARGFSRQLEHQTFGTIIFPPHHSPALWYTDLPIYPPHCLDKLFHQSASLPFCVTPLLKRFSVVQEFQPVVLPLRLSASR